MTDRLGDTTNLFLCANPLRNPWLFSVGLIVSTVQLILLLIIVGRTDAKFKAQYACDSVKFQQYFPGKEQLTVGMHSAFSVATDGFVFPGVEELPPARFNTSFCIDNGPFGEGQLDPQEREAVLEWAAVSTEFPTFLRTPFLQFVTAANAAFVLILFWTGGRAANALWCLSKGYVLEFVVVFANVTVALLVSALQVTLWVSPIRVGAFVYSAGEWVRDNPDVPIGVEELIAIKETTDAVGSTLQHVVPGISPVDIVINSVSVMLILDLDEKAFKMATALFYESYLSLLGYFAEQKLKYYDLESLAAPPL